MEKKFDPFFRVFLTHQGKNKDENKEIWKNEFDFRIPHIKIRLRNCFHENLSKKFFTHFFRHFRLIETKMKMKTKKFGKMSLIFEFSMSKIAFMEFS